MEFNTAIEWLAYVGLFSLGIYFILQAEVWQRYQLGRTNFAEYEEQVSERPTIIAYMEPLSTPLKLGQDFNIAYFVLDGQLLTITLTSGENMINDEFRIEF